MGTSTFKNHVEVSDDSVQGCYDGGQQVCLFGAVGGSGRAAVVSGCVRVRVGGWFHGLEDGAAAFVHSFVRSFVPLFLCSFVRWLVCSFVRSFVRSLRCTSLFGSLRVAVPRSGWQLAVTDVPQQTNELCTLRLLCFAAVQSQSGCLCCGWLSSSFQGSIVRRSFVPLCQYRCRCRCRIVFVVVRSVGAV